jgi:hypothetical protein
MWKTFVPAILGFVGVLVGGAIITVNNYVLARRREAVEKQNWRRDHALEAYGDVLKASGNVHIVALATYIADCNTEEKAKHVLLVRDAIAELHGVVDRVLLLSPKEMYDDLRSLVSYCTGELGGNSIKCPKIAETEWDTIQGAGYIRVHNNFTIAARNDLGIHSPHMTAEQVTRLNQEWKPKT